MKIIDWILFDFARSPRMDSSNASRELSRLIQLTCRHILALLTGMGEESGEALGQAEIRIQVKPRIQKDKWSLYWKVYRLSDVCMP